MADGSNISGILLIDKPVGWTSHDVVARIRSIIRSETGQKLKVGHAGTLDPAATGLLIILIDSYTKKADEFRKLDKTYDAELRLGQVSTTGDREGEISPKSSKKPTKEEIKDVLNQFEAEIQQIPHPYSAVKTGGQRAYKLARTGKPVKLEPRKVIIYDISNIEYDYPKLCFKVRVSSGTYIRSLAEDIGQKLSTGAYLSSLRRMKVGQFSLDEALPVSNLSFNELSIRLRK